MGSTFIILGTSVLAVLLAGYWAQRYLPPPKPKIVGIDLGTTFSCVGVYHAVLGTVDILEVQDKHKCIPSVVAFSPTGQVLVGYDAVAQEEHNPDNTLYDAKRFIGKTFTDSEIIQAQKQYPFKLEGDQDGLVHFVVKVNGSSKILYPEDVGAIIISTLREAAANNLSAPVLKAVLSVPAEFDARQRNYTKKAANLAGLEVLRIINEPTAAALAYGLHNKLGLENVIVVDLGGGTLDVSLLNVQGGMFLTQAMAGNNRLGGQDFNQRLMSHLRKVVEQRYGKPLTDREDLQGLLLHVEDLKVNLTREKESEIMLTLHSLTGKDKDIVFSEKITRDLFEDLNSDLFNKVLEPIEIVLKAVDLTIEDIDETILVGGSTRIPKIRELIEVFFKKAPITSEDPDLAVATGVSIQAGILGGMWPLTVSAVELPTRVKKIHV
ncbi:heat shock 70 kDa protein 13-like [Ruditapes philippinarum]|uniref:heat shock 70 kDa protein 13-like n=1 Tax=Ruditapes philippinarum TaxID=129788 RepID=UPI00295C11C1|nr:heat shock 70 kDa protein 13-like [Ruditapes philippinarum]